MESIVEQVLNAENMRVLVLLVFGFTCCVLLKTSFEKKLGSMEASLLKAMDEKINAFHSHLKANDFAHLNNTIEALTFMLEKNKFLEREDKEFIDRRLDR
jgi:inhibitor of KinA sporulation pathway (predicted exonuclease)